ncbi:hypothetical protein H5410_014361 [Solanum commersonii]|uniref:Uncharacterized protein n=1 Tax=Solanum commersonii TaxID=4109 RepID=A0A9J5ZQR7_SOLCO|nr:hypothetical protein H5410_014361 [Solanum commersonii]
MIISIKITCTVIIVKSQGIQWRHAKNFHEQEIFEKSFNATFIVLIPKKKGANELRDFRPISLIGNDTLIFCDAEEEQLKYLRVILVLFEGISGLHINWRKSVMYPINEVNIMRGLTSILGGEIGALPTTYLGMPLGANSKSIEDTEDFHLLYIAIKMLPGTPTEVSL